MNNEQRLQQLKTEMSMTFGMMTRWRRICAEQQADTVEEQIICAQEALSKQHSQSWAEGFRDAFRLREIELAEMFGGEIPEG